MVMISFNMLNIKLQPLLYIHKAGNSDNDSTITIGNYSTGNKGGNNPKGPAGPLYFFLFDKKQKLSNF